jgi:hypothetical protein
MDSSWVQARLKPQTTLAARYVRVLLTGRTNMTCARLGVAVLVVTTLAEATP